jgi:hypothetical protein
VLGSAVVLALLLLFVPRHEIAAALGRVPPRIWVGALAIYLTLHLIGVYKWLLLINAAGRASRSRARRAATTTACSATSSSRRSSAATSCARVSPCGWPALAAASCSAAWPTG